jgi:sensor c-di-GMP phosphodiesterase-like protein
VTPRRKLLVAIAAGVVLAGPPVAGFNLWLNDLVERQGQAALDRASSRTMALAERRIARTISALDALAARGVDSCRSVHLEALRQATFATTPVKEFSLVGPDGRTICSDAGQAGSERREVIGSEAVAAGSDILIEALRIGDRPDRWIRLRKTGAWAANGVAATIPSELLVADADGPQEAAGIRMRLATRSGILIREVGTPPAGDPRDEHVAGSRTSGRYALNLDVSVPRESVVLSQGDLRAMGTVASGLLAILILTLAMLMPRRTRENPVLELERALKAGEFIPYYQPIVDIASGRLRGAEVLMRWRKSDGTIVSPAAFIPLAESSGLIIDLTRALMVRVCKEVGTQFRSRPHFKIAFNLTARHFDNEDIVEDVRSIFSKSPIRLSQVCLEVTERQPLENLTETRRVVAALQGLGVRVAIDDVGTGHSGLSYMLKLGVDIIKIDKMFIDALGTDRNSNTIIETLIDLAQNMRMEIIAEGVESFEQVVHLRELGVRAAQGYVFAPPLPGPAFLQLIEAIDPLRAAGTAAGDAAPAASNAKPRAHSDAA